MLLFSLRVLTDKDGYELTFGGALVVGGQHYGGGGNIFTPFSFPSLIGIKSLDVIIVESAGHFKRFLISSDTFKSRSKSLLSGCLLPYNGYSFETLRFCEHTIEL